MKLTPTSFYKNNFVYSSGLYLDEQFDNTSTRAFYSVVYKSVLKSMDFESQLLHLLALRSWGIYSSFLNLSFFIFKAGIQSQDGCED